MDTEKHNSICKEAEPYYYDFICEENRQLIPDSIIDHIKRCKVCKKQVKQLRKALSQAEDHTSFHQKKNRAAIAKWLELHFTYIGKPVTCGAARPFLPGLLDQNIEIKIPTPITAHLEKCPRCREDLEAIRKANFKQDQLWQLGQILTGQEPEDLSGETAKNQQLLKIASQIAEGPESGVITILHIKQPSKTQPDIESGDIYAGFPVRVKIINREDDLSTEHPQSTIDSAPALFKKNLVNLRPFLKPAITIAAVILVAAALFFHTSTVKAVTIDQIYKAIEMVKNVYIATYQQNEQEPSQEKWISKTSNIYMTKTGDEIVLWDTGKAQQKMKNLNTGTIEAIPLTQENLVSIEGKMSGSLGLMPFYNISDIPVEHRWDCVTEEYPGIAADNVEIYDLTWTVKAHDGSVVSKKWRVFVDPKTSLPHRTEWYEKLPTNNEYVLKATITVEYPQEKEIIVVLEEASF